ncbi:hypothetical protein C8J57DRAFT_1249403 [Mycena rebaudengoi]|nr:hypothetical protein C8J57DRAFT_1249403 [Mycena rebaudengoi]
MEANPAAAVHPAFPEDLERVITEVLLNDTRDMCGTMSLVASRFHSWFHTVAVRVRKNCMRRLRHWVLPNAQFTRILVLDLPFKEGPRRGQWPDKMLTCIRRLLAACSVRKCPPPRLRMQRPASVKPLPDLGCAPPDLRRPTTYQRCGLCYVPELAHCVNLAYLTYACKRVIRSGVADLRLKGTMLVYLCPGPHDLGWIEMDKQRYPRCSSICMRHLVEVLAEWIAKAEGRESLLDHVVATPGPGVEFQATDRVD